MGRTSSDPPPGGEQPVFGIGAVARMLDLPPATLRTWEDRYDVISPGRSEGGRRLYSRTQVDQLRFVKARVAEGIPPADAHRLLAARIAGARSAAAPGVPGDGTGSPPILIAERDPHAADLARHFLRAAGYQVEVALDGHEAERRLAQDRPRLAIVELLFSDGRGAALCRRLKEDGVPAVIAVSSLAAREAALAAGADGFLAKPVDPPALLAAVRGLLGAPEAPAGAEAGE